MSEISTSSVSITATPTVDTDAYTANDAVGGLLTFSNAVKKNGKHGVIQSVIISDQSEQSAEFDLILFDRTFTATADDAAIATSAGDSLNCIGTINIADTDYKDIGAATIATVKNIGLAFKCSGGKDLFGQLVTRGTPTYAAATDIQVKLIILQD